MKTFRIVVRVMDSAPWSPGYYWRHVTYLITKENEADARNAALNKARDTNEGASSEIWSSEEIADQIHLS